MLTPIILGTGLLIAAAGDPQYWDPVIAGVTLEDTGSGKAFVMRHDPTAHEPADDFPQFRCLNQDGTELLELLLHYGSERYGFAQFRVRRPSRAEVRRGKRAALPSFVTGKGVRLGLTTEEVVVLLGAGVRRDRAGELSLRYQCSSVSACPGLQRVNMPEYEAIYRFRDGQLVAFEGGYPYP